MAQQGVGIHLGVAEFGKMLGKLEAHRKEYNTLCAGWEMLPATWVDKYHAIAKSILAGNVGVPASEAPPAPLPNTWPTPPPVDRQGRTVYWRHVPHGAGIIPPGVAPGAGQKTATPPNLAIHRVTMDGATVDIRRQQDQGLAPTICRRLSWYLGAKANSCASSSARLLLD
jgi:hypothetical protein